MEEAIASYRTAIQLNPKYTDCHFNLGLAYLKINSKEKARECFERCLSIDTNYDDARKKLQLLGVKKWVSDWISLRLGIFYLLLTDCGEL